MKVLHLIPSFGSGGAERQLSILAPALAEMGVECHICYCHEGQNLVSMQKSAIHLHRLRISGNHDPRLFLQIWRLINEIKPDVVQTWLLQMDVMGGAAALLAGVPFVLSERSSASAYPSGMKIFVRSKIGQRASAIVANSQGGADYWASQNATAPMHLIRNFVAPKQFAAFDVVDVSLGVPLVLFAGRLCEDKNVSLLLDALIQVMEAVPTCVAYIFGEGPLQEELRRKVADSNMGERIFLGGYTHNLAAWMCRADVFVSISKFEGSPNVILEAASLGCPVVVSDISAHRELLDEASAWFVKHKSVDDVRDGVLRALREKQARAVKAEKAKQVINSCTNKGIVCEYLRVYFEVVNETVRDYGKNKKKCKGI